MAYKLQISKYFIKPIGEPGRTVEIDESKFGRRKYNKGHRVEWQWVFGGFERESVNVFMIPVQTRDRATLLPTIDKWITSQNYYSFRLLEVL